MYPYKKKSQDVRSVIAMARPQSANHESRYSRSSVLVAFRWSEHSGGNGEEHHPVERLEGEHLSLIEASLLNSLLSALCSNSLSAICLLSKSFYSLYAISCFLKAESSEFIPWSPCANLLFKRVPGPQSWYFGTCNWNGRLLIMLFTRTLPCYSKI